MSEHSQQQVKYSDEQNEEEEQEKVVEGEQNQESFLSQGGDKPEVKQEIHDVQQTKNTNIEELQAEKMEKNVVEGENTEEKEEDRIPQQDHEPLLLGQDTQVQERQKSQERQQQLLKIESKKYPEDQSNQNLGNDVRGHQIVDQKAHQVQQIKQDNQVSSETQQNQQTKSPVHSQKQQNKQNVVNEQKSQQQLPVQKIEVTQVLNNIQQIHNTNQTQQNHYKNENTDLAQVHKQLKQNHAQIQQSKQNQNEKQTETKKQVQVKSQTASEEHKEEEKQLNNNQSYIKLSAQGSGQDSPATEASGKKAIQEPKPLYDEENIRGNNQVGESVISRRVLAASVRQKPEKQQQMGKKAQPCTCNLM